MGYTTDFEGSFKISPPLSQEHVRELTAFSEERHGGNMTPCAGFPGFWCDWAPNEDGTELSWNGGEKFYDYVEWLDLVIERFLKRWGHTLDGEVTWQGESPGDRGIIIVHGNEVSTKRAR